MLRKGLLFFTLSLSLVTSRNKGSTSYMAAVGRVKQHDLVLARAQGPLCSPRPYMYVYVHVNWVRITSTNMYKVRPLFFVFSTDQEAGRPASYDTPLICLLTHNAHPQRGLRPGAAYHMQAMRTSRALAERTTRETFVDWPLASWAYARTYNVYQVIHCEYYKYYSVDNGP